MRNVKILATGLRIFAALNALFTIHLYAGPYLFDYPMSGPLFERMMRIASAIVAALTQPVLTLAAAYLLEFLHDFKHQALERLNPEKNGAQ